MFGRKLRMGNKQGFTLIEVMIVAVITALSVGGGIAGYVRFNQKQEVEQTAENLATFLRTVQKRAAVGDLPESDCSGGLVGYRVYRTSQGTVLTRQNCQGEAGGDNYNPQSLEFPNLVSVSNFDMTFLTLNKGVDYANGFNGTITVSGNNATYEVTVTNQGLISVEDVTD